MSGPGVGTPAAAPPPEEGPDRSGQAREQQGATTSGGAPSTSSARRHLDPQWVSRRRLALGAGAAAVGGLVAVTGTTVLGGRVPLPFYGGFASALPPDLTAPTCAAGSVHWWGDRSRPRIALTFDDGPHPTWTPALLETLAAAEVRATFFVKGTAMAANPRVHRDSVGHHEIANHTWDHPDLGRLDHDAVAGQIGRCSRAIEDSLGVAPRLFRPPYGHLGGATILAAGEAGLPLVLWSARSRESRFADHPDGEVADLVGQVSNGSIILAHDSGEADRLIALHRMAEIVGRLRDAGYEFVTVSDLLAGSDRGDGGPAASESGAVD